MFAVNLKDKLHPCDVDLLSNSLVCLGIWYGVFTCGRLHGLQGGVVCRVLYIEKGHYRVTNNQAEELTTLKDCALPRGSLESFF